MNRSSYNAPTFLENKVVYDKSDYFKDMIDIEWRGQVVSSTLSRKFRIKYYGEIIEKHQLICDSKVAPVLVFAEDIDTKECILLHDGAVHGYNAMFCDEYDLEVLSKREHEFAYLNLEGNDVFEVLIYVYNGIDYDSELEDFINEEGQVVLLNGNIITVDELKRDGYDFIGVDVIDEKGVRRNIVQFELA